MKNRLASRIVMLAAVLAVALIPYGSFAESIGPDTLFTGICNNPVTVTVSSPEFGLIAQFGKDRTEALNKLLRHLSVSVTLDGDVSETSLAVDGEPVYSYIETTKDSVRKTVYSILPDKVYEQKEGTSENENLLNGFLEGDFFILNRFLDDFYPIFEKTAGTFKKYAKATTGANLNFNGYGKGVRRLTISLPDAYIKEKFPAAPAKLAETEETSRFIRNLNFSGPQKIILLYTQQDRLLRINFDGSLGLKDDSLRRVSAVWRCVRNGKVKKDNLTLKTPAVQGADKYNLTYEREADQSDPNRHIIKWNLQLDLKKGDVRKKAVFTADLTLEQKILKGKIVYSEKQEGSETKITIVPSLKKENGSEYSGTIEITNNSGKIETSSTKYTIRVTPGRTLSEPGLTAGQIQAEPAENTPSGEKTLQQTLDSVLIRKLLSLPPEDTAFFSMDIPEDVWNSIVQSLI